MKNEFSTWLILIVLISFALSVGINIAYFTGNLPAGGSTWEVIGFLSTGIFFISLFVMSYRKTAV